MKSWRDQGSSLHVAGTKPPSSNWWSMKGSELKWWHFEGSDTKKRKQVCPSEFLVAVQINHLLTGWKDQLGKEFETWRGSDLTGEGVVTAKGWREVCWISQARAGPSLPGKHETTLRAPRAQAGEQVCIESWMPLQAWGLEDTVSLLEESHQDGHRSGLLCKVTKRLCGVGTQLRQCTTGGPHASTTYRLVSILKPGRGALFLLQWPSSTDKFNIMLNHMDWYV